ncbi:copper transporter 5 isoform X1 [Rhodamnia argentea]|uniref:Copper transport protein n=1 Tax=Rhodamnia argentea TaxID=178133 RepID=A0A8B8PUF3_9MYRT|nr:copper transporter 5 isoform X1 [Rhodamnia argentea]XP_048133060.1 copper transporter 5 isoform X1 [Rhodamnia argentea]
MMHMTLYWSRYVTLLFDSWRTDSWPSYLLSLVACFLVSAFYQYMEDRRLRFRSLASSSSAAAAAAAAASSPPPASAASPLLLKGGASRLARSARLGAALLFGANSAIGYLLMLAIMSFNGGVFLAIIAGLTVGYYVFRFEDEGVAVVVDNPCACA